MVEGYLAKVFLEVLDSQPQAFQVRISDSELALKMLHNELTVQIANNFLNM
jgi:hypothetical protein